MRKPIIFFPIGLFFGIGIGFLWAASAGVTLDGHEHSENTAGHETMAGDHSAQHGTAIVITDGANAPTVDIIVKPDAVSGWNVEVVTTNFTFAPKSVNQPNKDGEGHAHIYVNGEKLSRIYAPWMHIGSLPAGETTVSVSLNANNHSPLSVGDKPLKASTTVQVQ